MLKVLFLRTVTLTWHGDIMNKSHIVYGCMYDLSTRLPKNTVYL